MNKHQKEVQSILDDYAWEISAVVRGDYFHFKFSYEEVIKMIKRIVDKYGSSTVRLSLKMYETNGFSKRDAFEQLVLKYEGCNIEEYNHKIKWGMK